MANFHPDTDMLLEYSAGTLPAAVSVCVATHLEFCVQCRNQVAKFDSLGGTLLEQAPPARLGEHSCANGAHDHGALDIALDQLFAKIDDLPAQPPANDVPESSPGFSFPLALKHLLPQKLEELNWRKIGASLSIASLLPGDNKRELALHRLRSGGGVANHDHRGEEITVVIQGSFSDQNGLYTLGDFLVRQPGEVHGPKASNDGDCICLSAMAAPVKFTGPITRLINPFLRISPSA